MANAINMIMVISLNDHEFDWEMLAAYVRIHLL